MIIPSSPSAGSQERIADDPDGGWCVGRTSRPQSPFKSRYLNRHEPIFDATSGDATASVAMSLRGRSHAISGPPYCQDGSRSNLEARLRAACDPARIRLEARANLHTVR